MESSLQVLEQIETPQLYRKLIHQLNKDFERAQCPLDLSVGVSPQQLIERMLCELKTLLNHNLSLLQQLLYLIDIPEKNILQIPFEDEQKAVNELCLSILQREWQKVYLRSIYSS